MDTSENTHARGYPVAPPDREEVSKLVRDLHDARGKAKGKKMFTCKETLYVLKDTNKTHLSSWKFNDWDYKRRDLPTYARGLFTASLPDKTPIIAIRGYNKFFNINEVHETQWGKIEADTRGPYELSVKENGCIIFISGLADGTLLVCSKHSTGVREDVTQAHSVVGERWIERQMQTVGKSKRDLACELYKRNVTAVAELCDDEFEEHILEYRDEARGLYLHGINLNVPQFMTYPGAEVQDFARKWGFKETQFVKIDSVVKTRTFLEQCAETGSWEGRDIEGFVIRCQARDRPGDPWYDWFFKYKFEEPYLMYRQWREVTKAIINGWQPRIHKHKAITEQYLHYARKQLRNDKTLGEQFNQNRGIIAMREGFLQERGLKGADIIRQEIEDSKDTSNIVLVPVATLGCGKTTLAIGLQKLFGWALVQNDNITTKKSKAAQFANELAVSLLDSPVVFADRNNHQRRERQQLLNDISAVIPEARFVALQYVHRKADEKPQDTLDAIRKVTRERVLNRGDNHQTIQSSHMSEQKIIGIMEGFINRFEPIDTNREPDEAFELVIDLDPTADSRSNLEYVLEKLNEHFPRLFTTLPTGDELDTALLAAIGEYAPSIHHQLSAPDKDSKDQSAPKDEKKTKISNNQKAKEPPVEYFGVTVSRQPIMDLLEVYLPSTNGQCGSIPTNRVQQAFHVTLIHRASKKKHPDVWEWYMQKLKRHPSFNPENKRLNQITLEKISLKLRSIIYDDRVVTINVELPQDVVCVNAVTHITIGTRDEATKPKYSNEMLEAWLNENPTNVIKLDPEVALDGELKAQESRF